MPEQEIQTVKSCIKVVCAFIVLFYFCFIEIFLHKKSKFEAQKVLAVQNENSSRIGSVLLHRPGTTN